MDTQKTDTKKNPNVSDEGSSNSEQVKNISVPIKLKGDRMATLSFPVEFTDEDLIKMYKVLRAYIQAYGDNINLAEIDKPSI